MDFFARPLTGRQLLGLDIVAGVVLAALSLRTGVDVATLVCAAGVAGAVGVRHRWPLFALAAAQVMLVASSLLAAAGGPMSYVIAVCLTAYSYAVAEARGRVVVLAVSQVVTGGALVFRWYAQVVGDPAGQVLQMLAAGWLVIGAPWVLGSAVRQRRDQRAREADRLAEHAVAEERLRIARELHDVVGHAMSVITVKAGVAARVADKRPEETKEALRVIEETGRTSLAEMRRMLGLLRSPGTAPTPGLDGLPVLVARAREAGVEVSLEVTGAVPEGMAQSVYRIVQEALTNVIKHAAPTRCRVAFAVVDGTARLVVADDGPPGLRGDGAQSGRRGDGGPVVPGHGLIGMRERVRAYGGAFTAGPRAGGGFEVTASWEVA